MGVELVEDVVEFVEDFGVGHVVGVFEHERRVGEIGLSLRGDGSRDLVVLRAELGGFRLLAPPPGLPHRGGGVRRWTLGRGKGGASGGLGFLVGVPGALGAF